MVAQNIYDIRGQSSALPHAQTANIPDAKIVYVERKHNTKDTNHQKKKVRDHIQHIRHLENNQKINNDERHN